jgi:DNA polymerase-3 subunit gamma/tau
VFENIIEQDAVLQLRDDILSRRCAPSMLFFGPPESGKGSAALEFARISSCEGDASWKCLCPACERHRYLLHSDLLMLGPRSFQSEISACYSAFLRNVSNKSAKILFIRSVRKLQMRFSSVLTEDDPKIGKLASVLQSVEEKLNEFEMLAVTVTEDGQESSRQALEKLSGSLVKDALSLANDGLSGVIPIGHIRRASYWCRLAPNGKRKTLVIENAENMREEARNSLLKLLEEPPSSVNIVLTSRRREAIMPTILSRLRPYRFLRRSAESEKEVIRRVFQDSVEGKDLFLRSSLVSAYLDSFLPANTEKLYPLAAWFIVSLARLAAVSVKKNREAVPQIVNALGERYAPTAGTSGLEHPQKISDVAKTLIEESGNFEDDSFSRFLKITLDMVSSVMREEKDPQFIAYNEMFKKYINEAETSVNILNISTASAIDALLFNLRKTLARGRYG